MIRETSSIGWILKMLKEKYTQTYVVTHLLPNKQPQDNSGTQ